MDFSAEFFRTVFSAGAMFVSIVSVFLVRYLWKKSNRPIVTAFITDVDDFPVFNLVVSNTGSRPAVNIRLIAGRQELSKLLEEDALPRHREDVYRCFSEESTIAVLRNGEELATSLGAYQPQNPWLNYGSRVDITIEYQDLEGASYRSLIPLKLFAREGFGGLIWADSRGKNLRR